MRVCPNSWTMWSTNLSDSDTAHLYATMYFCCFTAFDTSGASLGRSRAR